MPADATIRRSRRGRDCRECGRRRMRLRAPASVNRMPPRHNRIACYLVPAPRSCWRAGQERAAPVSMICYIHTKVDADVTSYRLISCSVRKMPELALRQLRATTATGRAVFDDMSLSFMPAPPMDDGGDYAGAEFSRAGRGLGCAARSCRFPPLKSAGLSVDEIAGCVVVAHRRARPVARRLPTNFHADYADAARASVAPATY